jgi:hypothetical protein
MEGGAVGVIGDTRNSPTWANSALARGFFDATWPGVVPEGGANSIRGLGDILNYGKLYMAGQVGVAQTAGSVDQNSANTNLVLYHVELHYSDEELKHANLEESSLRCTWFDQTENVWNSKLQAIWPHNREVASTTTRCWMEPANRS